MLGAALFGAALTFFVGPGWWPAVENPPKQCEGASLESGTAVYSAHALARTIREPQNTWSSFAFVAVAAWIVRRTRDPLMRWLAAALVVLALGAALYHASGTREWRHLDIAGLDWVYAMLAFLGLREAAPRAWLASTGRRAGLWCAGLALLSIALAWSRNFRVGDFKPLHVSVTTGAIVTFVTLSLLVVCVRRRDARSWTLMIAALVSLAVGVFLQISDRPGNWCCSPGGIFQAHAWWHLLGAASVALVTECLATAASWKPSPT